MNTDRLQLPIMAFVGAPALTAIIGAGFLWWSCKRHTCPTWEYGIFVAPFWVLNTMMFIGYGGQSLSNFAAENICMFASIIVYCLLRFFLLKEPAPKLLVSLFGTVCFALPVLLRTFMPTLPE